MTVVVNDDEDGSESAVLWAGLALTLQLIRLSIDIIQTASRQEDQQEQKDDDATAAAAAAAAADAAAATNAASKTLQQTLVTEAVPATATTITTATVASPMLPPGGTGGYGSIGDDEEQQRLLGDKQQQQNNNNNHANGGDNDDNEEGEDQHHYHQQHTSTWFETIFPKVFGLLHLLLIVYFTGLASIPKLPIVPSDPTLFSPRFFLLCDVILVINFWFLLWRDTRQRRMGLTHRIFSFFTAFALWWATLWHGWSWYYYHNNNNIDTNSNNSNPSASAMTQRVFFWIDGFTVLAVTVYFLSNWIHVRYTPYPPIPSEKDGNNMSRSRSQKRATLSRQAIFTLLRPYFWPDATDTSATWNRIRAIFTWVCVILSKVSNVISPILLGNASTALAHGQYGNCVKFAISYCTITFFGAVFKEGQSLIYLKVAQAAFVQLCETTFWHLHTLSLDWHLKKKLGEVIRSMDRGIGACDTLMRYLFLWLVPAMIECAVVCIIFATYFSYWPLAISVFYFVFIYIVWTVLVTVWRKKFRKAVVASDNQWHDLCTDSLINFETVKFFTAESFEMRRFGDAVRNYQAGSVNVQASLSFLNITQTLLLQACLATSLSLTAIAIRQRINCCLDSGCESGVSDCCQYNTSCPGMQVGDFVAVLSYTLQLFAPLNFLGSVYNAIVMAVIDLTSLSELLAESPDVTDSPSAMPLPRTNVDDPDIAVEFENVYFHYPTQPKAKGLKGLSFKMKRGTTTAIVGPTGSGKTTVSRLLFRFYDVLGGAVKVNGVDVRRITQQSLRGAIGVVPQTASMFNDTIRANLLYGRRDATQAELEQAARDSQILDFIESLDDGWETMVGDRGLKLSGGEKQRAAIARCLLKDPPFVLLDEATSALDTLTEASVQEALDRLGNERTVLVIAHRLGTIRNADNIIVLKDGLVHEQGTHDELIANNSTYADMWNMQLHQSSASSSMVGLNTHLQQQQQE